jgi:hypothetical protein
MLIGTFTSVTDYYIMKGTRFGMMLCCIERCVKACIRLTGTAKALATRDHVRDISGLSALSNNIIIILFISIEV